MPAIKIKRGDTFRVTGSYVDDSSGQTLDLLVNSISIASGVTINGFYFELTCRLLPQSAPATRGQFEIIGDTSLWPVGEGAWDVQFSQPSADGIYTSSTPTTLLLVQEDVTR